MSTIPPRSLRHSQARSSVHGAILFPVFNLAQFCKVPPAAFHAHHFRNSLSKDNKNKLSLSVTRSLVAHPPIGPCSPSVRECSSLPRSSVRQIIFVPRKSIVTGSITRHMAHLTHTVSSWRKPVRRASLRSSPSLGPSARSSCARHGPPGLVLPGPRSALSRSPYKGTLTAFSWHHFSKLFAHSLLVTFPASLQHATCRQQEFISIFRAHINV